MNWYADREDDYAACYGRLSGLAAKRFTSQELASFAQAGSLAEVVANLEGTEYHREIQDADYEDPKSLEAALDRHYRRIYRELTTMIAPDDKAELDRFLATQSDHRNLQAVVRGRRTGLPADALDAVLAPQGTLGKDELAELAAIAEDEEFVARLRSIVPPFGDALRAVLEADGSLEETHAAERALDLGLVESWKLQSIENPALADLLAFRVDATNLATCLRCLAAGIDPGPHLIEGGRILPTRILAAKSPLEAGTLKDLVGASALATVFETVDADDQAMPDAVALSTAAEAATRDYLHTKSMLAPLTLASLLDFLEEKKREVRNLRTILLAKHHGLGAEAITPAMG